MLRPLLALVALAGLAACDGTSAGAQRVFEDEALFTPVAGITETDERATVLSRDPSDWRIGPDYVNRVSPLLELPNPNPVRRGQAVAFLVDTQGVPGGLRLYVLARDRAGNVDLVPIADPNAVRPEAAQAGFYSFSVSASQIARGGPGLYRVVLLDGARGVVTYGDLEVTG